MKIINEKDKKIKEQKYPIRTREKRKKNIENNKIN